MSALVNKLRTLQSFSDLPCWTGACCVSSGAQILCKAEEGNLPVMQQSDLGSRHLRPLHQSPLANLIDPHFHPLSLMQRARALAYSAAKPHLILHSCTFANTMYGQTAGTTASDHLIRKNWAYVTAGQRSQELRRFCVRHATELLWPPQCMLQG